MSEVVQTKLEIQIRNIYKNPSEKDSENKFFIFPFLEILSKLYKENTYIWMNQRLEEKNKKNSISYKALQSLAINETSTIEEKYKELYDDDFRKHGVKFSSSQAIHLKITRTDNWLKEYIYSKSLDTKGIEKPLYKIKEEKIEEVKEFVKKFKEENEQKVRDMIRKHIDTKSTRARRARAKLAGGNTEIDIFIEKLQLYLDALKANTDFGEWIYTEEKENLKDINEDGHKFQNRKDENSFLYFLPTNTKERRLIIHTDPREYKIITYRLLHGRNFKNESGKITIIENGSMTVGSKRTRKKNDVTKRLESKGLKDNIITSFNINNLEKEFNHILADILQWADYRKQIREDYMNED